MNEVDGGRIRITYRGDKPKLYDPSGSGIYNAHYTCCEEKLGIMDRLVIEGLNYTPHIWDQDCRFLVPAQKGDRLVLKPYNRKFIND